MSKKIPLELNKRVGLFRNCSVCGSKDGLSLGTLNYALFDNVTIAPKFDVTCCSKCGFVTVNTPSTQRDYDTFYAESFYSSEYLARNLSDGEKRYFEQTVDILFEIVDRKDIAIFDIGCGVGCLLETLREHGFTNLHGVDPSDACVKLLTEQKCIRCETGTISSIPFPGINPDLLILSHIVEHIIDIKPSLGSIASRLSADGKVYVEVPDSARYNEYSQNKPLGFFYFQHVIHFDYIHLHNLFTANGLKEIKSGKRERYEKGLVMPCVWGIFQKDELQKKTYLPDFTLAVQIKNWFDNTSLDPKGQFAELVVSQTPIYVWGIGVHAQMMLAMSPLGGCNIRAFVDKSEQIQKKTINGQKIVSPDVLKKATMDEVVVIATVVHKDGMYKYLTEELNFKGQVILL